MSENVMIEKTLQMEIPDNNETPVKFRKKKKVTVYNVVVYGILGLFSLLCFFLRIFFSCFFLFSLQLFCRFSLLLQFSF